MKKLALVLVCLTLLIGCTERLYVSSDFDKGSDFANYRTYGWADDIEMPGNQAPMFDNELNRRRIREAIDEEMRLKGMVYSDDEPDLLIDFHVSIDNSMEYYVHDYYPPRYSYWTRGDLRTIGVKTGALIIHFTERESKRLVWQGVGSKNLPDTAPSDAEQRINEAVKAIIGKYPPKTGVN